MRDGTTLCKASPWPALHSRAVWERWSWYTRALCPGDGLLSVVCCLPGRGNTGANSSVSTAPRSLDPMFPAQKSSVATHSAKTVNLAWLREGLCSFLLSQSASSSSVFLLAGTVLPHGLLGAPANFKSCFKLQCWIRSSSGTILLVLTFVPRFFQDSPNDGLYQDEPGGDQSPCGARSQPAAEE